jgi:hypothetical protein
MKIKELIEYLNTLDKEARIFLQYDSYMWYDLEPECIEHVDDDDIRFREAKELGVSVKDYKIEMS